MTPETVLFLSEMESILESFVGFLKCFLKVMVKNKPGKVLTIINYACADPIR